MGQEWRNKALLYDLYHREGLTKAEIGERLGCSDVTIGNWMERYGIPTERAWKRASYLRWLYFSQTMTQSEIAEIFRCDQTAISKEFRKLEIETKDRGDYSHPSFYVSGSGYLTCRHRMGSERRAFRIHRLVAVAEYGFDAVAGKEVHHKNGHRVDNRPENLEPITSSEHAELHHRQGDILSN